MATLSSDLVILGFFRFVIRFDPKKDEPVEWLKDKARRKALGEAIFSAPLFRDGLKVGRADDDELEPITAKSGPALFDGKREVLVDLQGWEDDERDRDRFVQVQALEGKVEVRIQLRPAGLAGFEETALDDIVAVAQRVSKALEGLAGLDVGHVRFDFRKRAVDYARTRPPRESNNYPERSLITFIDPPFHKTSHGYARPGEPEKLTAPPPPSPAKLSKDGGLTVVRWARTLSDDDLVAAAAGHNAWIVGRIETDVAEGYNELGDERESIDGRAKPPLTLYDADTSFGYKAVLVMPDGSVEDSAWNEAVKIAKAKKLADGSSVDSMRIIVPLREHVFAVAERAKKAGFDRVVYPDDHGGFWNPDPPGQWLTPPVKNPKPPKGKG